MWWTIWVFLTLALGGGTSLFPEPRLIAATVANSTKFVVELVLRFGVHLLTALWHLLAIMYDTVSHVSWVIVDWFFQPLGQGYRFDSARISQEEEATDRARTKTQAFLLPVGQVAFCSGRKTHGSCQHSKKVVQQGVTAYYCWQHIEQSDEPVTEGKHTASIIL